MLYSKETLILEEIMATLLSNEIRKRPNQEVQKGSGLVITGRKGREEEKKVWGHQRRVTFVIGKIIARITANIRKSG